MFVPPRVDASWIAWKDMSFFIFLFLKSNVVGGVFEKFQDVGSEMLRCPFLVPLHLVTLIFYLTFPKCFSGYLILKLFAVIIIITGKK